MRGWSRLTLYVPTAMHSPIPARSSARAKKTIHIDMLKPFQRRSKYSHNAMTTAQAKIMKIVAGQFP